MRYLLSRFIWRRHDRATEVGATVRRHRHKHRALARLQFEQISIPLRLYTMPTASHLLSQGIMWMLCHSLEFIAIICTHAFTWVQPILADATAEVLARGHQFAVNWVDEYVSFSLHFGTTDVL